MIQELKNASVFSYDDLEGCSAVDNEVWVEWVKVWHCIDASTIGTDTDFGILLLPRVTIMCLCFTVQVGLSMRLPVRFPHAPIRDMCLCLYLFTETSIQASNLPTTAYLSTQT